jgi:two-component system response regulator HydG
MDEVERRHILHVLDALGWNKAEAARVLGINRATLYRKLQRYGYEGNGN